MTAVNTTTTDPILRILNVRKSFLSGERTIEVLKGVDLLVETGQSVSISGESGSGKSTLLNIIAGLETVNEGELFWEENRVDRLHHTALAVKRGVFIGMVFQAYYLIPELNAIENVLMAARVTRQKITASDRTRARQLLARVGLSDRSKGLATELSGGERQRVALARALMNHPGLILADEPTGNLDEKTARGVMDLLLEITKEERKSLVLVTHNREFSARTDRALHLHEGKLQ